MSMAKRVKVDPDKILMVIKSNNLKYKEMSVALGHDYTYISGVIKRGTMQFSDYMLFKSTYGVDIELKEEKPVTQINSKSDEVESASIDYDKLGEIAKAIIDYDKLAEAMSKVIDYDRLSEIICKAMIQALNGEPDKPMFEKRKLE